MGNGEACDGYYNVDTLSSPFPVPFPFPFLLLLLLRFGK